MTLNAVIEERARLSRELHDGFAQLVGYMLVQFDTVTGLVAANRDPERFRDPDLLDITRQDNRHLAFGWAAHYCFGAPLARIEAQIAFGTILRRLHNLALEAVPVVWRRNAGFRGLEALPVTFEPSEK